eukprot:scaffold8700_cov31-Tisochrysis_lutea.AAC.3
MRVSKGPKVRLANLVRRSCAYGHDAMFTGRPSDSHRTFLAMASILSNKWPSIIDTSSMTKAYVYDHGQV